MTNTHTPGPWHVNLPKLGHAEIVSKGGKIVLPVTPVVGYGVTGNEGAANAYLMAAAPDLLAALEWVILDAPHHSACIGASSGTGRCDCYIGAARAAIAKAQPPGVPQSR